LGSGKDDDGYSLELRISLNFLKDRVSVLFGHFKVQDNQVRAWGGYGIGIVATVVEVIHQFVTVLNELEGIPYTTFFPSLQCQEAIFRVVIGHEDR